MNPARLAASAILLLASTFCEAAGAKPTYTILDPRTKAISINDAGFVAGSMVVADQWQGFLRAPDGTITLFSTPGQCGGPTLSSINSANTIAGSYDYNCGALAGFVREFDGTITSIYAPDAGTAPGQGTFPLSINSSGTIAGFYVDGNNGSHGFVRAPDGSITEFDVPDAHNATPCSINNDGAIAGYYFGSDGITHGFIRTARGKITTFDAGAANQTFATSINQSGEVAGYFGYSGEAQGFIRATDGTITLFGETTDATAINKKGDVTGRYYRRAPNGHYQLFGFIRSSKGKFQPFKVEGQTGRTLVYGINAVGTVVGYVVVKTGKGTYTDYGFIRTR
jgi:hypothetical protein